MSTTPTFSDHASLEKKPRQSLEDSKEEERIDDVHALNVKLANPLAGISHEQLMKDGEEFARSHNLGHLTEEFKKAALIAQNPTAFESLPLLTEDDKAHLRREITHKWDQPGTLYYLVILCSIAAAVQGMDEAVINGANLFFAPQFNIDPNSSDGNQGRNQWLLGLVNSAPYLCCALIGCWLTEPLNRFLGRRGTIFVTATISFLACIWQGVTNSWQHLFIARFVLGLGIGPKSATVPVYAAECAPAPIRGGLVMMWQMWTAFGIMLGYVADLAFFRVPNKPHITGLNWRLMLASAGMPALLLMAQVFFCPESPRWLISKGRYDKAYQSLARLRRHPIQAARDLYYIHVLLETESQLTMNRNRFKELFTVPRNRRATMASSILMFMQQFCGVNAIAYYSSSVFTQANFSQIQSLLASFGFGAINWVMAFPAVWIPAESKARVAVVALGMYLFGCAYSPGEGPVPFTYSAEAYPLYVRDIGMSFSTAVLWFFNFVVAITFPRLLGAFKPQGAFGWYAGWDVIGFFLVLLFVPETKALSLEELDQGRILRFNATTCGLPDQGASAKHQKYIFRMKNVETLPPLYEHELAVGEKRYAPGGVSAA
ncbi:hypothetical protein EW146_g643 [Bondarzewia mesenterica]|uniref:Major facilitator superfamily (MFS) profile domain-containing protein n=1 Tax=Bondarzewia mesenterica TaxID=1095465 RepID=A0A4V3XGB7_9AGAM|nr:hypothetical protein EW146_g643 [Bondarzewia mesenterica]